MSRISLYQTPWVMSCARQAPKFLLFGTPWVIILHHKNIQIFESKGNTSCLARVLFYQTLWVILCAWWAPKLIFFGLPRSVFFTQSGFPPSVFPKSRLPSCLICTRKIVVQSLDPGLHRTDNSGPRKGLQVLTPCSEGTELHATGLSSTWFHTECSCTMIDMTAVTYDSVQLALWSSWHHWLNGVCMLGNCWAVLCVFCWARTEWAWTSNFKW